MEDKSSELPNREKKFSSNGDKRNNLPSSLQYLQPGFANPVTSSVASHDSKGSCVFNTNSSFTEHFTYYKDRVQAKPAERFSEEEIYSNDNGCSCLML